MHRAKKCVDGLPRYIGVNIKDRLMSESFKVFFHVFVLTLLIVSLVGLVLMQSKLLYAASVRYEENKYNEDQNQTKISNGHRG